MILAAAFQPYDPGIDTIPGWAYITCGLILVYGFLWTHGVLPLRRRKTGRHSR